MDNFAAAKLLLCMGKYFDMLMEDVRMREGFIRA